jgi:hypothetical protein
MLPKMQLDHRARFRRLDAWLRCSRKSYSSEISHGYLSEGMTESLSKELSFKDSYHEAFEFLSEASFWRPIRIKPSAWVEHLPFAFWIIEAVHPGCLVELGTYSGTSYAVFCQAVQTLGLETKCYAIDTWEGDEQAGFYGEEVFADLAAHNQEFYSGFSSLIRSTFDEASKYFGEGSIDLLHIDGYHTYDAVKHDFDQWYPKLSSRAVVLLHDINVREREFGVFRLWKELQDRWPSFDFIHGHGLGILGVGADLPDPLYRLFQTKGDSRVTAANRSVYASLGAGVRLRMDKEQQLVHFQSELSQRSEQIVDLEHELASRKERNSDLERELASREQHNSALERALELQTAEFQATLKRLETELARAKVLAAFAGSAEAREKLLLTTPPAATEPETSKPSASKGDLGNKA